MGTSKESNPNPQTAWPTEAIESIFSMGMGFPVISERRKLPRSSYAVQARLLIQGAQSAETIYTHSISTKAAGFVFSRAWTVGQRGKLFIPAPDGNEIEIAVTIQRCRRLASGWFDMSVDFARPQGEFKQYKISG